MRIVLIVVFAVAALFAGGAFYFVLQYIKGAEEDARIKAALEKPGVDAVDVLVAEMNLAAGNCVAALPIGWFLPAIILKSQLQTRQAAFTSSFPDALDLLVICVEAGLSIEAAFARVTDEMAETAPILAQEFGLTTAELAYLGGRSKALQNLSDRTAIESVRSLTTLLIQSEKYGTPLGTALRVISNENRQDRLAKVEEKAAALGAKLTVPMIAFFLPVIFLVVIGPAVVQMTQL
ncbi:MAG: type II secretion system F family protein [Alphaproteobacteria bacterium]